MIAIVAWSVAIVFAVPSIALLCELAAGFPRGRRAPIAPPLSPITVLVPAHDEAAGIARTIFRIREQLRTCDRLVVIADNCLDDTAEVARRAGAEVIERTDPATRGKAYALADGRDAIRAAASAVVLLIDADCPPAPHAIAMLAAAVVAEDAVVQAKYLLECDAGAAPLVRISTFAFLIKNFVRQRGLQRLCGIALLQGSGMGFPWRIFEDAPLRSRSLVEDLELGLELVLSGHRVRFEPRACFVSPAGSRGATASQRTRWEHGSLGTAARYIPRLAMAALTGRPGLIVLAANLTVPPLALFVTVQTGVAAMLLLVAAHGARVPAAFQLALFGLAMLAVAISWVRFGRRLLPAQALPGIAAYMVWKLPIYVGYFVHRQRNWVRTDRTP